MSLLEGIAGAKVVVVDVERRVVYAWFGGAGVNVYDEDGNEVHYFTIGADAPLTREIVERSIRGAIAAEDADDEED